MNISKSIIPCCLIFAALFSCKSNEAEPVVDQRDQHIGKYVCEVKVENYQTKMLLRSYTDTLEIAKLGEKEVQIMGSKATLPPLQILQHNGYYGLLTVLVFEKDYFKITSGHDSAFYEYKGYKLQ